ncbi:MAG: hypothetical protein QOF60_1961 [Actinomycetota bacterium]|jgi:nucleoside-diphosphate-sugar epimerase|nr:hypothetical protein [Actinomycetota bacterium]
MTDRVLVTGGAGYIGATLTGLLLDAGREVTVLDSLLHGQRDLADDLQARGAKVVVGDVRDDDAIAEAMSDADAVVHLAAIVGDPACARDPAVAAAVNLGGSAAVVAAARRAGVERLVFASTCSNYGRMADPEVPIDEDGELRPVSLYAEQKVAIEKQLLGGDAAPTVATCLRFATVYGVAARMRFDLTVNEFTRDLWAGRDLEVFGEQFWRPYVHVADAAAGIRTVLDAPLERVAGRVFNVGSSTENFRKLDLVDIITAELGRGSVTYVSRQEDPRDYKVSFERIADELGFVPAHTVVSGVAEVAAALEAGRFPDPFAAHYGN